MLYKHFKMTYFECTLTCFWKYLWWWGGCELSQLSLTWQGLGEWPKIHWSFGLLSVVLHVQTQAQVRSLFAVGTHLQNLLHKSSFVLSINKKELMKPKIFTLICRERLVNSLYRNFHTGVLLLPRAGLWSWARTPPAHRSLVIQSQSMLMGEPAAPGVCETQPMKLQSKNSPSWQTKWWVE